LFIVDRLEDMIITDRKNVYSAEGENAPAKHPAVAACAVIGVPYPARRGIDRFSTGPGYVGWL
jgi:acyl-CoA synthetase (AMP-forming)/AMP-acid ligase II